MMNGSNLERKPKRWEMTVEERIRDFQRKIYLKAKQEKSFKFYVLYDKVYRSEFITEAYSRVKKNKGAPGVDGVTFEKIEQGDIREFLGNIAEELKNRTYKPQPVKRVMIPKANGKMRPLGIPTIKDRVVQMSCKMVIEPIFEADFEDTSYGFRPKRRAGGAINRIKENLTDGKTTVYDADLSKYFDTIPHTKLLKTISLRIVDKHILHLIKLWLKAPVNENGKMSGGKKNKVGTPQGGVISPLLANIYLHLVDRLVNKTGSIFKKHSVEIVRYADDFVLMAKRIPEEVYDKLRRILDRMELRINEEKSAIIKATEEAFSFLGFSFRYDKSIKGRDKRYWNVIPSEKSCMKIRSKIGEYLKRNGHQSAKKLVKGLNPIIRGWINYFSIAKVSYPAMAKRKLRWYLREKLNRYYRRKSQRRCKLYGNRAFEKLVDKYGLINPCTC